MSQPARIEILETFKRGDVTLLVASDVAARGLDLPKAPVRWFGRPALHYRLAPLGPDLAGDFRTGVSYRPAASRSTTSASFSAMGRRSRPRPRWCS